MFDLVEDNGFYYIFANIKGYGNTSLLLDTNTPILLTKSTSPLEEQAILQSDESSKQSKMVYDF